MANVINYDNLILQGIGVKVFHNEIKIWKIVSYQTLFIITKTKEYRNDSMELIFFFYKT